MPGKIITIVLYAELVKTQNFLNVYHSWRSKSKIYCNFAEAICWLRISKSILFAFFIKDF